jgi:uncharacterized membrane protein YvlD (DUF360 family)
MLAPFSLVWLLVGVLIAAVVLRLVSLVTSGLQINSWGTALGAAAVMSLVSAALGFVVPETMLGDQPVLGTALAFSAGLSFLTNVVGLAISSVVVPGLRLRGASALLFAAVLITVFDIAIPYAMSLAAHA